MNNKHKTSIIAIYIIFISLIIKIPYIYIEYQDIKLFLAVLFSALMITIIKIDNKLTRSIFVLSYIIFETFITFIKIGEFNYLAYHDILVVITSYIIAIAYWQNVSQKEILMSKILVLTAVLYFVAHVINMIYGIELLDRNLSGNNNLTAYVILLSAIFSNEYIKNNKYDILFKLVMIFFITVMLKNRLPTVIGVTYLIYYFYHNSDLVNIKYKHIYAIIIAIIVAILVFSLNERFSYLLSKDLYIRLYAWLRVLHIYSVQPDLLGVGLGQLPLLFMYHANIYPELSLGMANTTFIYSHMYSLDRLISGGVISIILFYSIVIYTLVHIKKYLSFTNNYSIAFIVSIIIMHYDVILNYYLTMQYFMFIITYILFYDKSESK